MSGIAVSQLGEFTCFKQLPLELCQKIWDHTIHPRTLCIWPQDAVLKTELGQGHAFLYHQPSIMAVNQESRTEGLMVYQLYFEPQQHRGFYFNCVLDTLSITPSSKDDQNKFLAPFTRSRLFRYSPKETIFRKPPVKK